MSEAADTNRKQQLARRRWLALVVALAVGVAGAFFLLRSDIDELLRRAHSRHRAGDHAQAAELAEDVLARDPGRVEALVLAGDACFALEEFDRALAHYRQVPVGPSKPAVHARFRCGRIEFYHVGDTARAEASIRAALRYDPDNRDGLFQLISLLGIQARRREAVPFVLRLFRQEVFHRDFLSLLESEHAALFNFEELQRYRRETPEFPGVLIGQAWHARKAGKDSEAAALLKRAVNAKPPIAEARVALATLLWDTKQFESLRALLAEKQTRAIDDPRLWNVRGALAARDGEKDAAARCYWEAWRRNPTDRNATYQLFRYFGRIQDSKNSAALRQRLALLQQLRERLDIVNSAKHESGEPIRRLVESLEATDRLWEAWGWSVVSRERFPREEWAAKRAAELARQLKSAPLRVVCRRDPPLPIDLSRLPLPAWNSRSSHPGPSKHRGPSAVSFRDDAATAGIRFRYFNSASPAGQGQRMYEFNGGGCGVLDYDLDGWPDLHFTQGCRWPVRDDRGEHLDRIYRNLGDGRFADVTEPAGIRENRFSTGMAIGDFDGDGFPDLYVANIGKNRLFRNNGDGTFHDATDQAGVDDPRWSTSCIMADLNGDALPDIYSVNYLTGKSVFERVCQHDDGHPRMCMPFHFPAAQDQLYLNLGDGRFANATATSGVRVPYGKGLGVVAADWAGNGRLSLFVANDTVANFLFVNREPKAGRPPKFAERGLAAGVAVNRDGRAEGCMGIAVGDANDDGTLDLFVTNFLYESNTLYAALSGGGFEDRTRRAGLAIPSHNVLGFGTQFLDADLDGRLDLLVSNGHIDDYRRYLRPYKMPAQFFYNIGGGRFAETPAKQAGPYFTRKLLGRGMARLDWNRDGREDAVVSHLDEPAALLTNTTPGAGRWISFQLRGRKSSRDAIGATVIVRTDRRTITRQLTAGDGYQAGNERSLSFGLGTQGRLRDIEVHWPAGGKQTFQPVESNRSYFIVESSPELLPLPSPFE